MIPISQTIGRIIKLNFGLQKFWSQSEGWASIEAAGLLGKSRLDWQVSLSETLKKWNPDDDKELTSGELILAWTNLGSLVEGTLKLFLSVWYNDYASDVESLKLANAYDKKKGKILEPDGLKLEPLRQYFTIKQLFSEKSLQLVVLVQQRRNAIHAYKDKEIGTTKEFQMALNAYLELLREVNGRLPYPDDIYAPTDV